MGGSWVAACSNSASVRTSTSVSVWARTVAEAGCCANKDISRSVSPAASRTVPAANRRCSRRPSTRASSSSVRPSKNDGDAGCACTLALRCPVAEQGIRKAMTDETVHEELARARATIASQAEEIQRLQQRGVDTQLADEVRAVLVQAAVAGTIAAPVSHSRLLEMIVETA